jgi:hypothetical protein
VLLLELGLAWVLPLVCGHTFIVSMVRVFFVLLLSKAVNATSCMVAAPGDHVYEISCFRIAL